MPSGKDTQVRLSLERFGPHVNTANQRGTLGGLKHAGNHGNGRFYPHHCVADQP